MDTELETSRELLEHQKTDNMILHSLERTVPDIDFHTDHLAVIELRLEENQVLIPFDMNFVTWEFQKTDNTQLYILERIVSGIPLCSNS